MNRLIVIVSVLLYAACNTSPTEKEREIPAHTSDSQGFFPVTNYLRGQIAEIKSSGVNPLKIDSANGKIDSVWLKIEDFDAAFKDFLEPEIDSTNLAGFYEETKFADQTLDTYTFTYNALPNLPANNPLIRWDVYISRETNNVKSIFIAKQFPTEELQLTWHSNNSCKKVSIATNKAGRQFVAYEQVIKWNFN